MRFLKGLMMQRFFCGILGNFVVFHVFMWRVPQDIYVFGSERSLPLSLPSLVLQGKLKFFKLHNTLHTNECRSSRRYAGCSDLKCFGTPRSAFVFTFFYDVCTCVCFKFCSIFLIMMSFKRSEYAVR